MCDTGNKSVFVRTCVWVQEESEKVRAETKLDINLERSRVSDMVSLRGCVCESVRVLH